MIGDKLEGEPELYVEPFVGYRAWLMTKDLDLTSCTYSDHVYQFDRDVPATCVVDGPPHPVPCRDHSCGYWAFKTYEKLGTFAIWGDGQFVRGVRGLCLSWGRMILCEHGWRAEYARPLALLDWPGRSHVPPQRASEAPPNDRAVALRWNRRAAQIADRYGIRYVPDVASLMAIVDGSDPIGPPFQGR